MLFGSFSPSGINWGGGGYLCKHDTTDIWLIYNVQVVVAMVTRSVISSSEQFSAVQHVEMMTYSFCLLQLAQALPTMFAFH